MEDLNDMRYFAEIVEAGGFAAAGRALGIPKSRLSRRIAELEVRLGIRLLQRTTRKLSLTAAGERYLQHCIAVRDAARAAAEAVAEVQSAPRGLLRVVCPVTLAQLRLAAVLPRFLAQHPQVQLRLEVSNRVVDLVEEGVDIALRVRATLEDSGSLVVKRLAEETTVLVAAPTLVARQGLPAEPADLAALDMLAMSAQPGSDVLQLVHSDGRSATVPYAPRFAANDLKTLRDAVLAGAGACALPRYLVAEAIAQGAVVELLPGWGGGVRYVHAVYPSRRGLLPAARAFLDFLGEHLGPSSAVCPFTPEDAALMPSPP